MELKYQYDRKNIPDDTRSNRTFMELKSLKTPSIRFRVLF